MPTLIKNTAPRNFLSARLLGLSLTVLFGSLAWFGVDLLLANLVWPGEWFGWNILTYSDSKLWVSLFLFFLGAGALRLVFGPSTSWLALILFYGMLCLVSLDLGHLEAHWSYAGWMLLLLALDPQKEQELVWARRAAWIIFGASFSCAGISKVLHGDWWANGSAIGIFLGIGGATDFGQAPSVISFVLQFPAFLKILTWATLAMELLAFPLALFRFTRPILLGFGTLLHLSIFVFSGRPYLMPISFGMLVFYLFVFELTYGAIRLRRN